MGSGDGHKTDDGKLFHGGAWRDEKEWPLARTRYTEFYLQPNGKLAAAACAADKASTCFQFDPRNPVPTIGGCISSGNDILLAGAWDQRGGAHIWNFPSRFRSARNHPAFQTEPLEKDIEVTGEISAALTILGPRY